MFDFVKRLVRSAVYNVIGGEYSGHHHHFPDPEQKDAFQHAYASAEYAHRWGTSIAGLLGEMKEMGGSWTNVDNSPRDSWRDKWNNEVGLRIDAYAEQHHLPEAALDGLVMDAYKSGQLIRHLNDPRIHLGQLPSPTWNAPSTSHEQTHPDKPKAEVRSV